MLLPKLQHVSYQPLSTTLPLVMELAAQGFELQGLGVKPKALTPPGPWYAVLARPATNPLNHATSQHLPGVSQRPLPLGP